MVDGSRVCVWFLMRFNRVFDGEEVFASHASAGEVFNRKGGTGRVEEYMYGSALSIYGERALISPDQMHTRNFMVGKIQQVGNKKCPPSIAFSIS